MSNRPRQHGFTLAEMLMALAICAVLMTAAAFAVDASFTSFNKDMEATEMNQVARTILARMMKEIRAAYDVDSSESGLTIMFDETGQNTVEYAYLSGQLYYTKVDDGSSCTEDVIGYDDDFQLSSLDVIREEDAESRTVSVTVRLELTCNEQTCAVTSSAAVRQNQTY